MGRMDGCGRKEEDKEEEEKRERERERERGDTVTTRGSKMIQDFQKKSVEFGR